LKKIATDFKIETEYIDKIDEILNKVQKWKITFANAEKNASLEEIVKILNEGIKMNVDF